MYFSQDNAEENLRRVKEISREERKGHNAMVWKIEIFGKSGRLRHWVEAGTRETIKAWSERKANKLLDYGYWIGKVVITPMKEEAEEAHTFTLWDNKLRLGVSEIWVKKTKIDSWSTATQYVLTEFDDGHFECTCPHFVHRCTPGVDECKHIK